MMAETATFEATVRAAWRSLVCEALPREACRQGWPMREAPDFERILLDAVTDGPGAAGLHEIMLAVELGGRVLDGQTCIRRLDHASRALRAEAERPAATG